MNDVEISKKKNTKVSEKINLDNNSNEEYFDYDWLNDDDEQNKRNFRKIRRTNS